MLQHKGKKMRLFGVFLCMFIVVTIPFSPVSAQVKGEYAVVAGGDIKARDIIIKHGLTEEEVRTLVLELQKKESAAVQKVAELAAELGVTQGATKNFFRILREEQVPAEKLLETLAEIAERHMSLLAQAKSFRFDDPGIEAIRREATKAIDLGEYDGAETLLAKAEQKELEGVQQLQTIAEKRLLNAAATRAQRGELSLTRLNYLEAAKHFKTASDRVPASYYEQRGRYLNKCAYAYKQHGYEKGDNKALLEAIRVYNSALKDLTRERVPLGWAMTQNNLGAALSSLGKREAGTARLEEAVAAYREALKECTRERVPLDWAMTQNDLGTALQSLGEREKNIEYLKQAKIATQSAHSVLRKAGYSQYDNYFHKKLRILEQLIEKSSQQETNESAKLDESDYRFRSLQAMCAFLKLRLS